MDFLEKELIKLDETQYVILDEADRMLDMGFELDIRQIVDYCPEKRQSLLFSATFPASVKALSKKFCFSDAIHLQIGSADALTGNKDITQEVTLFDRDEDKENHLYSMISEHWDKENRCWKEGDYK